MRVQDTCRLRRRLRWRILRPLGSSNLAATREWRKYLLRATISMTSPGQASEEDHKTSGVVLIGAANCVRI
jgi:hypothetical protein